MPVVFAHSRVPVDNISQRALPSGKQPPAGGVIVWLLQERVWKSDSSISRNAALHFNFV